MRRNKFSLSHYKQMSMNMGGLYPCGLLYRVTWQHFHQTTRIQQATSMLIRMQPMLAPVMHPVHVHIHHWFVPHRLIWDDFEDFITGGPDGDDASVFPTITFGSAITKGELADYIG